MQKFIRANQNRKFSSGAARKCFSVTKMVDIRQNRLNTELLGFGGPCSRSDSDIFTVICLE